MYSILIVDSDELVRETFREIFVCNGYAADAAENGAQARAFALKRKYDACVIDTNLPDMNGYELLDPLSAGNAGMVKIMLAGFGSLASAVESREKGADGFFRKPVAPDRVLGVIEERLSKPKDGTMAADDTVRFFLNKKPSGAGPDGK
ncbi:MAG: response regulator [Elusimicrobiaceae bacterium]